jgi:hypothetical protein
MPPAMLAASTDPAVPMAVAPAVRAAPMAAAEVPSGLAVDQERVRLWVGEGVARRVALRLAVPLAQRDLVVGLEQPARSTSNHPNTEQGLDPWGEGTISRGTAWKPNYGQAAVTSEDQRPVE